MPTTEYLNLSDIAKELGVTRQAVSERYRTGTGGLPKPDGSLGARGAPIWKRSTLERVGILGKVKRKAGGAKRAKR